jgi:hypothetical protein
MGIPEQTSGMGTVGRIDVPEKSFHLIQGENSRTSFLKSHEVLPSPFKSEEVLKSYFSIYI